MGGAANRDDASRLFSWRKLRWGAAVALLLLPLAMMQISDEWHWTFASFLLAGLLIGGVGLLYDLVERASDSRAYRAGAAVALVTPVLILWTSIVRDDADGIGSIMLVLAAAAASFTAWLRPAAMARAMSGMAVMQVFLALAMATAPPIAATSGGVFRELVSGGVFASLWLISAVLFRVAARTARSG